MSPGLTRELIALRVARELKDGYYVNLGIGIPTLVANFIPSDIHVTLHSENGMLGFGRLAEEHEIDPDLANAGGQYVTLLPGACFFHHADSFAMIRGGHLDVAVLGGLQVSEKGDLANWMVPERGVGSIGGAMDLAYGAKRLIVAMEHTTREGRPRLVRACTYPLTGKGVVKLVVTNVAVIEVASQGLLLREVAPGVSPNEVQSLTEPRLIISPQLKEMEL
ncbi:MAG: 3-oxoacid CoA-transferase subunit B [Chloroflexota bacterium]|nr:3-oxoacid CoA-transferase subunit B [Chloroflexota bacterium]